MGIRQWMIWYAICLHWVWGATLLSSPNPLGTTPIYTLTSLGVTSPTAAGVFYLIIASAAIIGMLSPKPICIFLLSPQAAALWIAAYGAVRIIFQWHSVDDLNYRAFSIVDQIPIILAAVFHTIAIVDNFMSRA